MLMASTPPKNDAANMKTKREVIGWIDHILERKDWTGTDLARKSEIAPSTVLRLMNDPNHPFVPTLKTLKKIAEGSGYPIPSSIIDALGTGIVSSDKEDRAPRSFARPHPDLKPSNTMELTHISSLPVSIQGVEREEVRVSLPDYMVSDPTSMAFNMPDGSLEPWIPAGSLLYGTRRRDPKPGDIMMVTLKDGRSIVRLVHEVTEDGFVLAKSAAAPVTPDRTVAFDDVQAFAVVQGVVRF